MAAVELNDHEMIDIGIGVLLVATMVGASYWDIRWKRIPNALTLAALAVALVLRATVGWGYALDGLLGAVIAFALAIPLFLAGGLGGVDVKLITAAGAMLGKDRLWFCLLVMALVGGVMAIFAILRRGSFRQTAANLHTIFVTLGPKTFTGWKGEESQAPVTLDTPGTVAVPYGVAIAAGAVVSWFTYSLNPGWSLIRFLTT